jgi:hypothetical protein
MSDKPAILQETTFTVEEGTAYRLFRTGAIWMNKLFFSSLVLLGIWLMVAATGHMTGCVDSVAVGKDANGSLVDQGPAQKCSVFLTPTAEYLGAMSVLSFLASLGFGALGLVVGKRILESTPAAQEVGAGAQREGGDGDAATVHDAEVPGRGP